MKVVLFSMLVRAVCLTLDWSHQHESLMCALEKMKSESNTYIFPETIHLLDEIGFLYCYLPWGKRSYRIELPFSCTFKLESRQDIEAIFAQVPPFFFILPEKKEDKYTLQRYLNYIMRDVQDKLQDTLEAFIQETKTKVATRENKEVFIQEAKAKVATKENEEFDLALKVVEFFHSSPHNGCLLFFKYLDTEERLEVNVDLRRPVL